MSAGEHHDPEGCPSCARLYQRRVLGEMLAQVQAEIDSRNRNIIPLAEALALDPPQSRARQGRSRVRRWLHQAAHFGIPCSRNCPDCYELGA